MAPPDRAQALRALQTFNPDFSLTPEVLEIMRAFFLDLRPTHGTVSVGALADALARLDPSGDTTALLLRDMHMDRELRLDFKAFCDWVMTCKQRDPQSVRGVYTSWAAQVAALDFGLGEGDAPFPELKAGDQEALSREIIRLLRARQQLRETVAYEDYEASIAGYGIHPEDTFKMDEVVQDKQDRPDTHGSIWTVSKSFIAGGMAGIVAKSALAPLDRVKILFQVNDKQQFSFRNAARLAKSIYVTDGFHALFRGNMLNILRVIPYAGLQHSGFDFFRHQFHSYNFRKAERDGLKDMPKLSNLQLVTAGSLAGGLSLVVAYPLDILRARYMVQQGHHRYRSIYEAVVTMYKEGGARSFSRGLVPSLLGTLPYTGIGFSLNERFKIWTLEFQRRRYERKFGQDAPELRLNPFTKFVCSYFAACIAQTSTYPMDTIRRRIQTDGYVTSSQTKLGYNGVVATGRIILAREGWRGLFKGVSVNWLRSPVSTGISLTTYDILKEVLGVEKIE